MKAYVLYGLNCIMDNHDQFKVNGLKFTPVYNTSVLFLLLSFLMYPLPGKLCRRCPDVPRTFILRYL